MKILLVASEVAPFAKTGGLADVAGSLPHAVAELGHEVRVLMPLYRIVRQRATHLQPLAAEVSVAMAGRVYTGRIWQGELEGLPVYFLDAPEFFDRHGLYGNEHGDYADNALRFGFLCRAALAALKVLDYQPEVLHLNDWQTGLIPVLLRTELAEDPFYRGMATLLTIHNLGYQGLFPPAALAELGLDPALFSMHAMEYYGKISFLKGGIVFADLVSTVSETYCQEIQTPAHGHGFDGILRQRAGHLLGIVNGIDTRLWDPGHDSVLPAHYTATDPTGKGSNKRALQRGLGLTCDPDVPILAMVTRLATQKGLDLLEAAWSGLLDRHLQFVLLGSGEKIHEEFFTGQRGRHPGRVAICLGFDDALSRHIYAGSDLFLMPSHYEPCGLGQLIALRYGTIPVVRRTGGLADTVHDPLDNGEQANGFCFREPTGQALLAALDRALAHFGDTSAWRQMVRRAMSQDFSWRQSARRYLEVYQLARQVRNG